MDAVIDRFFEAFDELVLLKRTNAVKFCAELNTDRPNFLKQRRDHSRAIIRPYWLQVMAEKYAISPVWLLTGRGPMFRAVSRNNAAKSNGNAQILHNPTSAEA